MSRIKELEDRLREAEETLEAIRSGQVDALVVQGPDGDRVFTLEGADHRYRQLVETMNEGALLLSKDGTIVYANARFATLVAVPHERLLGSGIESFVAAPSQRTLQAMLRNGAKAELDLVAGNGARVPVYLSATAGWDEDDQLTCVIATDLSEQKRNAAMIADERLIASVVDQAAEGIVVCDPAGKVIRASQAAQRLTGENPLLLPFARAFPLRDPEVAHGVIQRALAGTTVAAVELSLADRELLLSAGPVLGGNGEVLGCVVSFVDVTERLRLHERANEARAEAEAANRAKDEFLAMLGHELRNPLAPILTAIELMKARAEPGAARERDVIERQVNHLMLLVNDLLDVSRIAQGKVELHKRHVPIAQVVAQAVEACSPILEERRHQLVIDVPADLIVDADQARLCQIIANLLTNAAKYTHREGRIEILGSRDDGDVVLRVRDNGMGIAAELLPTLFDRFVQSRRTIDRSEGGLGLGLSIVRNLVALHGGTIAVRSGGIGRGSEFEVRLPACERAATPLPVATPAKKLSSDARKILIVDDNTDAAELLADVLSSLGHQTRVAFDGPSGLEAAAAFAPDIAFLDIGLPAMDGYELARKMRAELAFPDLRLVALTGYGQESDRQLSKEAGFDLHMVKPINLEAITSTIRRLTTS